MTIILISSIPHWLDNKLLIELCEAFGKIKLFKRLMNSEGVYLDFLFLSYEEERSVYYFLHQIIGIRIGNTNIVLNTKDTNIVLNTKDTKDIPEEIVIKFDKIKKTNTLITDKLINNTLITDKLINNTLTTDKLINNTPIIDCPDKEISCKLNNALSKIKWNFNIYKSLSLLDSGKTLETLKLYKINELRKQIEIKLRRKPLKVDYDKIKAFLDKFG